MRKNGVLVLDRDFAGAFPIGLIKTDSCVKLVCWGRLGATPIVNPTNDCGDKPLRLEFELHVKPYFGDSHIITEARLLAYHEFDDALDMYMVGNELVGPRQQNSAHADGIVQSVFGRLSGCKDADGLGRAHAMRWTVGGRAVAKRVALAGQLGSFVETGPVAARLRACRVARGPTFATWFRSTISSS